MYGTIGVYQIQQIFKSSEPVIQTLLYASKSSKTNYSELNGKTWYQILKYSPRQNCQHLHNATESTSKMACHIVRMPYKNTLKQLLSGKLGKWKRPVSGQN
jgi:hypothetical protein